VRVILFVGHNSDRIASRPAWTQECGVVSADDEVSRSRHGGQAPRLRDVLRNIITFGECFRHNVEESRKQKEIVHTLVRASGQPR
jgi:hypothetical protein